MAGLIENILVKFEAKIGNIFHMCRSVRMMSGKVSNSVVLYNIPPACLLRTQFTITKEFKEFTLTRKR